MDWTVLLSVAESGDDLESIHNKHVLLLVNHQSTADIPCVMSALLPRSQVIGQIFWIMDYIFIYSNFGWISYLHGDFFIQQVRIYLISTVIVFTYTRGYELIGKFVDAFDFGVTELKVKVTGVKCAQTVSDQ